MMELAVKDTQGMLSVSRTVFGCDFNVSLVHQVVIAYIATSRQGTQSQKNRSEVSGSSKKPWRQKGTGRARAGSVKSPIWRSGGVSFAARPRDYSQKINKKMYRNALKSILSELVRQDRLIIVEEFSLDLPKTKFLVQKLKKMNLCDVLIIMSKVSRNLFLSSRNLYKVDVRNAAGIDPVSLITFDKVLMNADAAKQIEVMLG